MGLVIGDQHRPVLSYYCPYRPTIHFVLLGIDDKTGQKIFFGPE